MALVAIASSKICLWINTSVLILLRVTFAQSTLGVLFTFWSYKLHFKYIKFRNGYKNPTETIDFGYNLHDFTDFTLVDLGNLPQKD